MGNTTSIADSALASISGKPWLAVALVLLLLAPLVGKALTIDDPLFVWTARQIQQHPLDPYGFEVNWFYVPQPMTVNVQNPPVTSYWLALAGLVGWNDTWLHLVMLPFPVLLICGVLRLARLLGADPFWAGVLTLGTSAFLVSATSVMCDVMMLTLMVWSISLWIDGLNRGSAWLLAAGAAIGGLAALTKYFAVGIIALLAAYTLIRNRRQARALAALAIPLALLVAWHLWSRYLYGASHLLGAAAYANKLNSVREVGFARFYAAMTFLGGCLIWPLIVGWWRGNLPGRLSIVLGAVLGAAGFAKLAGTPGAPYRADAPHEALAAIYFAAGVATVNITVIAAWRNRRNPTTWLLALWIFGTVVFMAVLNWTVAARNVLPLVPALALLAAMPVRPRSDATPGRKRPKPGVAAPHELLLPPINRRPLAVAATVGLAVALVATWADFAWANSVRDRASILIASYGKEGNHIFFMGHWGFQYYMMKLGAAPLDLGKPELRAGDVWILPENNTNTPSIAKFAGWNRVEEGDRRVPGGVYLMATRCGAGFYSSIFGPLPLSVAAESPDRYWVLTPSEAMLRKLSDR